MLQFWESTQEYNVLVLLVLSPRHLPMATSGVLHMVQGRPRCVPALRVLHSQLQFQRKLGASQEHEASATLILTSSL